MASRFQGRDFQTLRQEIIDFVKSKAPDTWDATNVADPMVVMIESIAMMADHLHYYIDAMRRESDMATANLASSVYSYALREGYIMTLPRSTHFRVSLYSGEDNTIENVTLPKFSEFSLSNSSNKYYLLTPLATTNIYSHYPYSTEDSLGDQVLIQSPEVELVAGELKEVRFTFTDIDYYSRIELPESRIDPSMCQLIAQSGLDSREMVRVEDVISDLASVNVYSLTPSFVSGVERLYIEFPYNYRNLFPVNTSFIFRYVSLREEQKPYSDFESSDYSGLFGRTRIFGGYHSYESPESIKQNYKHYVRDFTSLVTKFDYQSFVMYNINSRCQVFDKSDQYSGSFVDIPVRTIYILSDLDYTGREALRDEILKRSSRSDNIFMIPYGRKLYRLFVIVEANLLAESEEDIRSAITSSLVGFYNDITEVRDPIESVIYHRIHSCNSFISRAWVILISEYYEEEGNTYTNFPTEEIVTDPDQLSYYLSTNKIFKYFYDLLPSLSDSDEKDLSYLDRYSELKPNKDSVIYRNLLVDAVDSLSHFKGDRDDPRPSYEYKYPTTLPYSNVTEQLELVSKDSPFYYDKPEIDTQSVNDPEYSKTHFILPSLLDTVIWVYST